MLSSICRKQVFTDLQPYVCTFEDYVTSNHLFSTRAKWFQHESTAHRQQWVCNWCGASDAVFSNAEELKGHLINAHPVIATET